MSHAWTPDAHPLAFPPSFLGAAQFLSQWAAPPGDGCWKRLCSGTAWGMKPLLVIGLVVSGSWPAQLSSWEAHSCFQSVSLAQVRGSDFPITCLQHLQIPVLLLLRLCPGAEPGRLIPSALCIRHRRPPLPPQQGTLGCVPPHAALLCEWTCVQVGENTLGIFLSAQMKCFLV